MRTLLLAGCIACGLLAWQSPGSAVPRVFADVGNGNSDAAHMCQKGGYLQLQSDTGQSFASEDQCVSYAAQAGTLYQPKLNLTFVGTVAMGQPCGALTNIFAPVIWCVAGNLSGFHPNSPLTFSVTFNPGSSHTFAFGTTDASGSFPIESFGSCPASTFTETITARDAQGLSATNSATFSGCL